MRSILEGGQGCRSEEPLVLAVRGEWVPCGPSAAPLTPSEPKECVLERFLHSGVMSPLFIEEEDLCCYNNLAAVLLDPFFLNHLRKISCHNNTEQFLKQSNMGLGCFFFPPCCLPPVVPKISCSLSVK